MPVIGDTKHLVIEQMLFATDFTVASKSALSYAKALAKYYNAELNTVHVIDTSLVRTVTRAQLAATAEHDRDSVAHSLTQLRHELRQAGIHSKGKVLAGASVASEMFRYTQEHRPQLMILGTSAARRMDRFLLGSTAEHVIRRVQCPVLTVGPNVPPLSDLQLNFRRIIYATGFSPQAAIGALYALSLAAEHGAHISLCYVNPKSDSTRQAEDKFRESLKRLVPGDLLDWCTPECVIEHGQPSEAILRFALEKKADLIVLGEHPASGFVTRLLPGVAFRVIAESHCPVLTIPSPRSNFWAHHSLAGNALSE